VLQCVSSLTFSIYRSVLQCAAVRCRVLKSVTVHSMAHFFCFPHSFYARLMTVCANTHTHTHTHVHTQGHMRPSRDAPSSTHNDPTSVQSLLFNETSSCLSFHLYKTCPAHLGQVTHTNVMFHIYASSPTRLSQVQHFTLNPKMFRV